MCLHIQSKVTLRSYMDTVQMTIRIFCKHYVAVHQHTAQTVFWHKLTAYFIHVVTLNDYYDNNYKYTPCNDPQGFSTNSACTIIQYFCWSTKANADFCPFFFHSFKIHQLLYLNVNYNKSLKKQKQWIEQCWCRIL